MSNNTETVEKQIENIIGFLEEINLAFYNKSIHGLSNSDYRKLAEHYINTLVKIRIIEANNILKALRTGSLLQLSRCENKFKHYRYQMKFILCNSDFSKFLNEDDDIVDSPWEAMMFDVPKEAHTYLGNLVDDIETWKEAHSKDDPVFEQITEKDQWILDNLTEVRSMKIYYSFDKKEVKKC